MSVIKVAQIVGVPLAGILAGTIGCMSFAGMPAIALAPSDVAAKQWKRVYDIGVATMPPLVVSTAVCFGFLAYSTRRVPGLFPHWSFDPTAPTVLYGAAAILMPCIVPWTLITMVPTNDLLEARVKSGPKVTPSVAEDAEVRGLIEKWSGLNYTRAAIVATGAVLAASATVLTP